MQIIGEHVLDGLFDRGPAGHAMHESDFSLLLVPYRVSHNPQSDVALSPQFLVGHDDRTCVMFSHQLNEQLIE